MKTTEKQDVLWSSIENQPAQQNKETAIAAVHGIPQTDADLTRAFVLKSHSEETRRTYRTTLQTFAGFCEKRHGRKLDLSK